MELNSILFSFISRIVALLLLFLCPLTTNGQNKLKQIKAGTDVIFNKVKLPPVPKLLPPIPPVPVIRVDIGIPPVNVIKRTPPVPSVVNPSLLKTSLKPTLISKFDINYYASPLNHIKKTEQDGCVSVPINVENEWWIEYIGGIIEEQMIQLRMDKMEKLLFKNGMQIDVEMEIDTEIVGYIIYNYEYRLDAA